MSGAWWDAVVQAGAVRASFVPPAAEGRAADPDREVSLADVVEGDELGIHAVTPRPAPRAVTFLDGIEQWKVVGYDGVTPLVRARVAVAARRRAGDRRLATLAEDSRDFAVVPLDQLSPSCRAALQASDADVVDLREAPAGQPGAALDLARRAVDTARAELEKAIGEECAAGLGPDEWLVVDGLLSVSTVLARHPRVLGVIKSHGAQFFEGRHLERALTLPAAHRTSVFRVRGGHARTEVYSWYLRLWPWEGNDLLYGLVRVEAAPGAGALAGADAVSGWLARERAPLSTPDARFDRLLYPIHDVEQYLRARAPRDFFPGARTRLPRTGT
ncbi:MAG TPA: hypothetical protein VFK78_07730 [Gemmatimonadales bacterium]|nr:hypothetical protein [Gemmatimonadales bacterium]